MDLSEDGRDCGAVPQSPAERLIALQSILPDDRSRVLPAPAGTHSIRSGTAGAGRWRDSAGQWRVRNWRRCSSSSPTTRARSCACWSAASRIRSYDVLEDRLALREMLGCVVDALTEALTSAGEDTRPSHLASDFLGSLFMELELSSHWHGPFFTPYVLCEAMARMTYSWDDMQRHVDEDGFVTVLEPACGAGAMVIAFADVMREYGFLPHEHMHMVAVDVDATAAHMCFIQLALLGVPAAVHVENTLTGETREVFYTPAHILGAWSVRLWLRQLRSAAAREEGSDSPTGAGTAALPPPDISHTPLPDDDAFALALRPARQMDLFAA